MDRICHVKTLSYLKKNIKKSSADWNESNKCNCVCVCVWRCRLQVNSSQQVYTHCSLLLTIKQKPVVGSAAAHPLQVWAVSVWRLAVAGTTCSQTGRQETFKLLTLCFKMYQWCDTQGYTKTIYSVKLLLDDIKTVHWLVMEFKLE